LGDVAVKGVDQSTTAEALEQISLPAPPQREGM